MFAADAQTLREMLAALDSVGGSFTDLEKLAACAVILLRAEIKKELAEAGAAGKGE